MNLDIQLSKIEKRSKAEGERFCAFDKSFHEIITHTRQALSEVKSIADDLKQLSDNTKQIVDQINGMEASSNEVPSHKHV